MKLLLCLLLMGCSYTKIDSPKFKMRTQANMKVVDVKADGSFRIEDMNHSTPTLAGGKAISNGATAFGTAATGLATGLLSRGL